jgi:ATP-binding cassette subfamily B protein
MTNPRSGDALGLDGAPDQVRFFVEGCLEPRQHELGEELVVAGAVPEHAFVVVSGRARASVRADDGTEREIAAFGPGSLIAPEAAGAQRSTVTVRASGPVRTLALHGSVLRSLAETWAPTRDLLEARDVRLLGGQTWAVRAELLVGEAGPDPDVARAEDGPRTRRARRVPVVFGTDEMDCGAACLTAVIRSFGHPVSFAAVRAAAGTGKDGTSLLGLHQGAQALGLTARMETVSTARLDSLALPAVCHVDGNHWVVLDAVRRHRVRVMDPIGRDGWVPRELFADSFTGYALSLAPAPGLRETPRTGRAGDFVRPLLREARPTIIAAAVLAAVIAAAQLAIPLSSQWIIDQVINRRDTGALLPIVGLVVGVLALASVATLVQRYISTRAALRFDRAALDHVAWVMLRLPTTFFHTRRTGDIERRLNGLRDIRSFFLTRGVVALISLFEVVGAIAIIGTFDLKLALLYVVVVPPYAAAIVYGGKRMRPAMMGAEDSWARYRSRQLEAIRGIETIKASGTERFARAGLARQFDELSERLFRSDLTVMLFEGLVAVVALVPMALFLVLGADEVVHGSLTLGRFVAAIALVIVVTGPMTQLVAMWDVFQQARIHLARLGELLDDDVASASEESEVPPPHAELRLDRVGFSYPGRTDRVVADVSFVVRPGRTVAIAGRSGAGKSTVLQLALGLLHPDEGRVTFGDRDLAEYGLDGFRRRLGVVLQDNLVFDGSIADNIAYGDDEPNDERVLHAARAAGVDGFVRRLPLGYSTRVGERGAQLSGGERQRLALARALYRDPAVLVLDEATSALDAESERLVQEALRVVARDRAVLVVAHRVSTLREADEVLVLDGGRVVERGSHEELLARGGLYAQLAGEYAVS